VFGICKSQPKKPKTYFFVLKNSFFSSPGDAPFPSSAVIEDDEKVKPSVCLLLLGVSKGIHDIKLRTKTLG